MLPVAIQLYSLRDDAKQDLVGTLKAVKEYGYDGVEFAGLYGKAPSEVAELLREIGLVPVSAHVSLPELLADTQKVIDDYKAVGCKNIVIPWLSAEDRPGGENYEKTRGNFERIGKLLAENGMVLSYHNHDFEFARLENGEFGFDNLYDTISSDVLKMQMDTCWVSVAGESPIHYLEKYANRCPLLHLKDYVGEKSDNMYALIGIDDEDGEKKQSFEFRPVGHGVQDFEAIIKAAEKCGVEWLIVEQDEPTNGKTCLECAKLSREYLKTIGY
ncbi:MAG: sugar phosphate isomerase/epimerase [Clostridia bacterium]|nr:sugar phosphate isomerase/epimerase [Clostridia bacterium]